MDQSDVKLVKKAKKAAMDVLLNNIIGPYYKLPRTAAWGYPEPYTRDLLISSLGILASGNQTLIKSLRIVLETLAKNQSPLGHIPSLVHDSSDRGASDTTPLFILVTAIFREVTKEKHFLKKPFNNAFIWMKYQSPSDRVLVAQLPTSDWRDEQWVLGFGLYVNTIVYSYLKLTGHFKRAEELRRQMCRFLIKEDQKTKQYEGLRIKYKPYYALWSYKMYNCERFDLLGNSMSILSGLASPSNAERMVLWIEKECLRLKKEKQLAVDLPPCLFPYIQPVDEDWRTRYNIFNSPGEYHNGGIWPFVCGFYISALVAIGKFKLAEEKLVALTKLNQLARGKNLKFGFNEWIRAHDGIPMGEDWQTWSASMYLYATNCIEQRKTPFFDKIRNIPQKG